MIECWKIKRYEVAGVPKLSLKIPVEAYLEAEKTSGVRREYLDGEICAMTGSSKSRSRIIKTLLKRLSEHFDGSEREPFIADIKVRVEKLNRFYYPERVVVCDQDNTDEYYATKPKLIVEVSSNGTSLTDRREKMFAYQEIESLVEYVLTERDKIYAEVYRRREDSELRDWIEFEAGEKIEFASINFKMSMEEVYLGVTTPKRNELE